MNSYAFRKTKPVNSCHPDAKKISRIICKTTTNDWVNTQDPIILPFSIHSAFHEGTRGTLKVEAFLATIKENTQGKITILLTEGAHVNATSLSFSNDYQKALQFCQQDAKLLAERFKDAFQGFDVQFWHSFIRDDADYTLFKNIIMEVYNTDAQFQQLLRADAESTYSQKRAQEFPNKELHIAKTIQDLLEQIVYLFVVSKRGYRFDFYPGNPYSSSQYINHKFFPTEKQLKRIPVCVSVGKR